MLYTHIEIIFGGGAHVAVIDWTEIATGESNTWSAIASGESNTWTEITSGEANTWTEITTEITS
jgi:hypothetical protein